MLLFEKLGYIKQSELYKLTYNGSVLGLRVKLYDSESEKFGYCDFSLDLIKNKDLLDYFKGLKSIRSIA